MNARLGFAVEALKAVACLAQLAMMVLVVSDVAGRYVLGRPLPGAIELVQYAMVLVVFTALPIVTLQHRHISLDVLNGRLRGPARRVQWVAVCLACAVVLGTEGWLLFNRTQGMRTNHDVIGYLNLPVYPAGYFMCALSLVAAFGIAAAAFAAPAVAEDAVH